MEKQKQKHEAIKRMKQLELYKKAIEEFEDDDVLNRSDNGILFWLIDEEKRLVSKFEKEYDAVVYHVIRNNTSFGVLLSLLYVSNDEEEWEMDREDIKEGTPIAYVYNLDEPMFSEFGSIEIVNRFGGLVRTA